MLAEPLIVSLRGREIGDLTPTRRGATFSYRDNVVAEAPGRPLLSLSLPVKRRRYAEGLTGSWFRGLLPEGERLSAIARTIGCDEADYVSILRQIGWECAGAVSIRPERLEPPVVGGSTILLSKELAQKLRDLPTYGGIDPVAHTSLGGYQEKLLLRIDDIRIERGRVTRARWQEPDSLTISTHILKPQPQGRYPGIAEAEAWAMSVAKQAARCANVALLELDDAPQTLVVERYDRTWHEGKPLRVHQEDCCQAMGLLPREKYAGTDAIRGNDPSYKRIAELLDRFAADPKEELTELLRQLVTNFVLGNVDAHAKNYALLYRELGVPTVAPMYDVVPVIDIEPRAVFLSMRIGGAIRFDDVERYHILDEATSWGLPHAQAISTLDGTLEHLREGIQAAEELYPEAAGRHSLGALSRISVLGRY
ncbi:MAG: HipA domain-containing protein [Atopobiaceae bacterium]|nr:HipA domain-containing protein [Atopobiaceae bacterium]